MYKKTIAILLCLCIVSGLFTGVAATNNPTVSISNHHTKSGDIVEMSLALEGCNGFVNLGLEIGYDSRYLKLIEVVDNAAVGATCTTAQDISKNPYNIGWDSTRNIVFNGTLATLKFMVYDDAPDGEYAVTVDYYKGRDGKYQDGYAVNYDENDKPLDLTYREGYIVIKNNDKPNPGGGGVSGGGGGTEKTPVTVSVVGAEGYAGDTVNVTLDVANNEGFANLGIEIDYDSSVLTLVEATGNDAVEAMLTTAQYIDSRPYNLSWDSVSNVCYNGNLATFTFKIAHNATPGDYPVEVSYYKGRNGNYIDGFSVNYDENENPLTMEYLGGVITVLDSLADNPDESNVRVEFISQKTVYAIGEAFEVDVWLYADDYAMRISENDYQVSGFDSTTAGKYNVVVSYGGFSKTFEVEVEEDKVIEVIPTYVVQTIDSKGVKITPSGYSEVKEGTVMKFAVVAEEGYDIKEITVNKTPVYLKDGYVEVTVMQNMTFEAVATMKQYSVTAETTVNGRIELSSDVVYYGKNCSARIVANEGYIVSDVLVDGKSVGVCKTYTFSNVKENHTISAVFEKVVKTLTVNATAGTGGKIYPAKSIINAGGSVKFTITPDYGYHIAYVKAGDEFVAVRGSEVVLENVTESKNIAVVFEKDLFEVTVKNSAGLQMSVEYNGQTSEQQNVPYMDYADIVINVENGYKLNTLYVNNSPVKATKTDGKLIYSIQVTKDTVVSARCGLSVLSEFKNLVALAGFVSDIDALNADAKKAVYEELVRKYNQLSLNEKLNCTTAYATVLAALDRSNAYIELNQSGIVEHIKALPSLGSVNSSNYNSWKSVVDSIYSEYEKLTALSKSLIDYELVAKLLKLRTKIEEIERELNGVVNHFNVLVDLISADNISDAKSLSVAYSKLMLAEDTYYGMSEQEKALVSNLKYNEMLEKHGRIATQIQMLFVTPFTGKVLRCSAVTTEDSFEDAETKKVIIYDLMNEYHSLPLFVQEQIPSSVIQKLYALYESASISISASVNNLPIQMNGDFDEDTEVVLTEPVIDNDVVSTATGKALYQAIDVKMYSQEQEIQPASKIRIKMEIGKELASAGVGVVYINDENVLYDVQGEVIEEDGKFYVAFFIDHFSKFAILYSEDNAEDIAINFDREYVETGNSITATVDGIVNSADCLMFMTGYSAQGQVTFIEKGTGSVTATVTDDTAKVKATLWDEKLTPIVDAAMIYVSE